MTWSIEDDLISLRSGLASALQLDELTTDADLIDRVEKLQAIAGGGPYTEEGWKRHIDQLRVQQNASAEKHRARVRAALDSRVRWEDARRRNEQFVLNGQPDGKTITDPDQLNRQVLDFPTAWYLQKGLHIQHDAGCASHKGLICDCGAVRTWWEQNVQDAQIFEDTGEQFSPMTDEEDEN